MYTTQEAAEITGVTFRQLDHWCRSGSLKPSLAYVKGHRRYSYNDLVDMVIAKGLYDLGCKHQTVKEFIMATSSGAGEMVFEPIYVYVKRDVAEKVVAVGVSSKEGHDE